MPLHAKMDDLIKEIRDTIPFNLSFDGSCSGRCDVCPQKLIEFLDIEVSHWESRLKHGGLPGQTDLENLTKDYERIYAILNDEKLIKSSCLPTSSIHTVEVPPVET